VKALYNKNSLIYGIPGFIILSFGSMLSARSSSWDMLAASIGVILIGQILLFKGISFYAMSKGYQPIFFLLGLLGIIGIIILMSLPDKWNDEITYNKSKIDTYIVTYIVAFIILSLIVGGVLYFTKYKGGSNTVNGSFGGNSISSANGGGVAGGSDMRAQMEQFRTDHKFTFLLTRLVGNIGRLDGETDTPLTQDQAKKILAQLEPLRKATSMNQDEAKDNIKKFQEILTSDQRDNIAKMKERKRRFNGPGGGGGQGGGGQAGAGAGAAGGQGGNRQRGGGFKMEANFNPFNTTGNERAAKRYEKLFSALQDRADGKPAVKLTDEQKKAMEEGNGRGPGGPGASDSSGKTNTDGPGGGGPDGGGGPPPPPSGG
jgi:hypothetical protein